MQRSLEELREGFSDFGYVNRKDGEVVYPVLCEIINDNQDILQLADNVPLGQPFVNILLGGIHYLLLSGTNGDLGEYYHTVKYPDDPRPVDEAIETVFLEFVEDNKEALMQICLTRRVQTNEIGRCSFLLPGLNYVQSLSQKPLSLIELGTSAGLLLNFNKYSIRYFNGDQDFIVGLPDSFVKLDCEIRSNFIPPIHNQPNISKKVGIDLEPINCAVEEDALWLQSLVWPENIKRFLLLKNALDICRMSRGEIEFIKGDAFRDINSYLQRFGDPHTDLVIHHSFAINQITKQARDRYYEDLKTYTSTHGKQVFELRNIWLQDDEQRYVLNHIVDGEILTTELARMHHHGRWIEWFIE